MTLIVVMGVTLALLYLPQTFGQSIPHLPAPQTRTTLAVGILGLALLFYLYVMHRLGELTSIRKELMGTRLREELLRGRLSELSSLFETTARAATHADLDRMLDLIVRRILICLEADQSSVLILDREEGVLRSRAASGRDEQFVRSACVKFGEGVAGWVAEHNEPLVLDDHEMMTRFPDAFKRGRDISTALCVPLCSGDEVVGVLNINRIERQQPFTAMDLRLVMIFAEHIGSAVLRMEELSTLDKENSDLQESNQQLTKLNRMKELFLAAAKHEMRTPLAAILASSDLLKRDGRALEADRHEKLVNTIYEQADHLRALLGEITELSGLEGGSLKLDRQPHDLNRIIEEALRATEGQAARRGIRIVERLDGRIPEIDVDALKMRQVIINLLTNAAKFSSPGGVIEVISRCEAKEAIVEVVDHGMGIRADDMEQIFELFTRTEEAVGQSIEGLGLGLYLVKRYVEVHDGRVWVESAPNKGSRFLFALPTDVDSASSDAKTTELPEGTQDANAA